MLIEIENDYIVVGIGCNMFHAPVVSGAGADAGRHATCVWSHCQLPSNRDESSEEDRNALDDVKKQAAIRSLGVKLYTAVSRWLEGKADSGGAVVDDFQRMMTKSPQHLRQANGTVHKGAEVVPIRINDDGSLEVLRVLQYRTVTLYYYYFLRPDFFTKMLLGIKYGYE